MRASLVLPLLAALAACAVPPPREPVPPVPLQAVTGAGDPERQAVISAAWAFANTERLAGNPAEAARAVARLEWMAAAVPTGPRWAEASALAGPLLARARAESRGALGIAPQASAVAATRALVEAGAALDSGNRAAAAAALGPVAPGGGEAMLARLDRLPPLPRVAEATWLVQQETIRPWRDRPD